MDALSDILNTISLKFSQVGTLHLSAPGAVRIQAGISHTPVATCLAVIKGESLRISYEGAQDVCLEPGDVAFLASDFDVVIGHPGLANSIEMHLLWERLGLPPPAVETEEAGPLRVVWGGGGKETLVLGIAFGFAEGKDCPLVQNLPNFSVIKSAQSGMFPWIPHAVSFFASEDAELRPGFSATARILSELIFVNLVRAIFLSMEPAKQGWLKGLLDPKVARSLSAIHKSPERSWTVTSLADHAGMSRTAFFMRFSELVGDSPFEYLTKWRVHLAKQNLRNGKCHIGRLANDLGFSSDATFRQTFKRHTGLSPRDFVAAHS